MNKLPISKCAAVVLFASTSCLASNPNETSDDTNIFKATFFEQFNPQTALDIIERVPGFTLDAGDDIRGFGAGAGNVLINGARPTSKSGGLTDALLRIPAAEVQRVEILRGSASAGEAAGQSLVLNIIRTQKTSNLIWEVEIERAPDGTINPIAEATYSGTIGAWETSFKLNGFDQTYPRTAVLERYDGDGVLLYSETEDRPSTLTDIFLSGDARKKNGESILQLNGRIGWSQFYPKTGRDRFIARMPDGNPDSASYSTYNSQFYEGEIGGDYTKPVWNDWSMKLVGLTTHQHWWYTSKSTSEAPVGTPSGGALIDFVQDKYESILRATFTKTGNPSFRPELGGEVAYNRLESNIDYQTIDTAGTYTPVPIAVSDTTVQEKRAEVFGNILWRPASNFSVEAGLTAEASEIKVSGDAQNKQSLTYLKPSLSLAYDASKSLQLRLGARRSVGQLNFSDFASSADIVDDRITTGNAGLRPDKTSRLYSELDYRFGKKGSLNIELYHEWINDTLEFILLADGSQGFGNAGNARLWGYSASATLPLDFILKGAQLDIQAADKYSRLTDPINGERRRLTRITEPTLTLDFRHDMPANKIAWGAGYRAANGTDYYYVGEIDSFQNRSMGSAFVESSHIDGMKIRLDLKRIGKEKQTREREFYSPTRAGILAGFERTHRTRGMFVSITLSGQF